MDSSTEKKAKKTKEIDQKEESSKRQLTCWKEEQQGMSPFIGKRCCKPSQVSNDTFQRVTSQVPKPSRRPPKQREENAVQRQPPKTLALQRKIRALWNRLSEGNAETIAKSLETMLDALSDKAEKESFYSSLVHLLLESLNSHSSLVSSVHPYIAGFAAVVAFFHFRGHLAFSVRLVYPLFQQILAAPIHPAVDETDNNNSNSSGDMFSLLILAMELYKLRVIHCQVIYELIRYFAGNLSEMSAQCLLVIIRRCGAELRRDDPRALKDIIEYIREKAEYQRKNQHMSKVFSTRLDIMLELIYDWKDNKLVSKEDGSLSFAWLSNASNSDDALLFSLELLQDWPTFYSQVVSKRNNNNNNNDEEEIEDTLKKTVVRDDPQERMTTKKDISFVDKVVGSLRLNTDTRRNIFRMMMTSEDVVDAEHRLVEYGGKRKSLIREIANMVILGCCHERPFNPFYVALTKRLCLYSTRYTIAFQFSLWQLWKRMETDGGEEEWSSGKVRNLSNYVGELVLERVVPISCFRVLPNVAQLTPSLRMLVYFILEKAKSRPHDDWLRLLEENASNEKCRAFYFTLYFLLQEWKEEKEPHARVDGWLHFLQSCNLGT